jgi:hypothetical protein
VSRPALDRSKFEGSSPLLLVPCPSCNAKVGAYCKKGNGERQVIAHKVRTRAFLAAGYTFR